MKSPVFFNAHHSPVGSFATFTLGERGPRGGLGLELGGPANESIFIGLQTREGEGYEALPFFKNSGDAAVRYDVSLDAAAAPAGKVRPFADASITREFRLGSDTWRAGDITFTIYSPVKSVPDPGAAEANAADLKAALVPAVFVEFTVDNTRGSRPRKAFFGYEGSDRAYHMRRLDDLSEGRFTGIAQGPLTAIASDSPGVYSGLAFTLDKCLEPDRPENLAFGLGSVAALMAVVPAGEKATYRFAVCFHRNGIVTSGMACRYLYNRWFADIESVAEYALQNWSAQQALALASDRLVENSALSASRRFQLIHAVRSYFGSTELLEHDGRPFWVVNEGEYRMMNTFDLTVDHLFFELARNPWVVRNQLDWFVQRYSYTDEVFLPGDPTPHPGGLSFTHDMGVANCISRPRYSIYEMFGLHGCFSHMTHEQLVNWVCCAVSYVRNTGDQAWLKANLPIFRSCLESLVNRDHPDPARRDGIMSADSSRCLGGSEITTYDSLDASLGQARNNLYLAVKSWAAYLGLREIFSGTEETSLAQTAARQATLAAATIVAHREADGRLPAILGEGDAVAYIIPAIEGLVFPHAWGLPQALAEDGEFGAFVTALRKHLERVLVPGVCLFPDGGWKLSSTNDNSWLSKIYLCQHVARAVFGHAPDSRADEAHATWLLRPENSYFAWSDQMVAGVAKGSKYYPRGVTAWLWLGEG